MVRRHPERKRLESLELKDRDWKKVLDAAHASGLPVVVEALDVESLGPGGETRARTP